MTNYEPVILTNMCMIENEVGQILVQDRAHKDWPGITFPGGKVEKGESFVDAVIREVKEETGLTIQHPQIVGIKQFQTNDDVRYIVIMYRCNTYAGTLESSDEGEVFWIDKNRLTDYTLANDFEQMYNVMVSDIYSEFFYDSEWNVWIK